MYYYNTTRHRRCCSQWLVLLLVRCHLQDIINIGYTLCIKLNWFDAAIQQPCLRFSNYIVFVFTTFISKFVVGWLVCCWLVVVCCKLKLDSGRNLYELFHWIKKKVCLEQSFQHGSHRSFISISHHPLSRECIVSHFSSNYYYYPWIIEDIVIQIFECSFPFF
jgi:hypothetical protein